MAQAFTRTKTGRNHHTHIKSFIHRKSRSPLFLCRGWLSKSAPASVAISIRKGFNLPFCPLALSWKGHVSSTTNCTLLSQRVRARAWWSTRLWVRELHPVFVQDMAWRRVVSCRQPLPRCIPPTRSAASYDPRLLPKVVSRHREPSTVSSCETPRHSTNAMAPFFRAPLNLTVDLFIVVFSSLGILQELLPTVRVDGE